MKEQNCLFCHHQSTVRPQITQVDSFEFVEGIRAPKQTPKQTPNKFLYVGVVFTFVTILSSRIRPSPVPELSFPRSI